MIKNEIDKEDEKILRMYCDKLPIVFEYHHEKHRMKGSEMLEMGYVLKNGETIDPKLTYDYEYPVKVAVNHYRRLRQAWLKDGQPGILSYLEGIAKLINADNLKNDRPMLPEGEVIYNETVIKFSFWDRIRILFGKKVRVNIQIMCKELPVTVLSTTAKTTVDRIFPRKGAGQGLVSPNDKTATNENKG